LLLINFSRNDEHLTMSARPTTQAVWSLLSDDLRRFLRRRVADEHVADDLLQETFLRVHRGVNALEDADRLAPWVYQIARNVVVDHYRKGAFSVASLVDEVACGDDEESIIRSRAEQWMDELIRQLPEKYQAPVRLSEIEGISQQEVATRLGLSLSAAKSRIQRGRAMLREILDQCCSFEFDQRGNVLDCDPRPDRTGCRDCDDIA
jgi:RNA polymerase sigma-70 factor (ECF subfamily)